MFYISIHIFAWTLKGNKQTQLVTVLSASMSNNVSLEVSTISPKIRG